MSRMVDDDFWEPPEDRARVVREQFERAGISTDARHAAPKVDPMAPARLAALAEREGFLSTPGGLLISPTLAKMLHYHPAEMAGQLDADYLDELDSMESMRR